MFRCAEYRFLYTDLYSIFTLNFRVFYAWRILKQAKSSFIGVDYIIVFYRRITSDYGWGNAIFKRNFSMWLCKCKRWFILTSATHHNQLHFYSYYRIEGFSLLIHNSIIHNLFDFEIVSLFLNQDYLCYLISILIPFLDFYVYGSKKSNSNRCSLSKKKLDKKKLSFFNVSQTNEYSNDDDDNDNGQQVTATHTFFFFSFTELVCQFTS